MPTRSLLAMFALCGVVQAVLGGQKVGGPCIYHAGKADEGKGTCQKMSDCADPAVSRPWKENGIKGAGATGCNQIPDPLVQCCVPPKKRQKKPLEASESSEAAEEGLLSTAANFWSKKVKSIWDYFNAESDWEHDVEPEDGDDHLQQPKEVKPATKATAGEGKCRSWAEMKKVGERWANYQCDEKEHTTFTCWERDPNCAVGTEIKKGFRKATQWKTADGKPCFTDVNGKKEFAKCRQPKHLCWTLVQKYGAGSGNILKPIRYANTNAIGTNTDMEALKKIAPTYGYRTDCSGFTSAMAGIPQDAINVNGWPSSGGFSTIDYVDECVSYEIKKSELKPGDIMLKPTMGSKTGHVLVFAGWYLPGKPSVDALAKCPTDEGKCKYTAYEESSSSGALKRNIPYPYYSCCQPDEFKPRRLYGSCNGNRKVPAKCSQEHPKLWTP